MKPRHAAALALWGSRFLAVLVLAFVVASSVKITDARLMRLLHADPQAFLLREQRVHGLSMTFHIIVDCVAGALYFCIVEGLAWWFRKLGN